MRLRYSLVLQSSEEVKIAGAKPQEEKEGSISQKVGFDSGGLTWSFSFNSQPNSSLPVPEVLRCRLNAWAAGGVPEVSPDRLRVVLGSVWWPQCRAPSSSGHAGGLTLIWAVPLNALMGRWLWNMSGWGHLGALHLGSVGLVVGSAPFIFSPSREGKQWAGAISGKSAAGIVFVLVCPSGVLCLVTWKVCWCFLYYIFFFSFSCRIELTLLPHTVCETYRCVQAFHLEGMPGSHSSRETGRSLCRTKAGISCHWIGVELSPFWAASASPETSLDDAPSLTASFPSKGAGEPRVSQGVCGEGRAECSNRPCVLCLSLPWNRLSAPQWHLQCTRLPCPARLTGEVTAIWGLYLFSSVSLLCGGPVLGSVCHCRRDRKTVSPHHEPVSYENFKHA